MDYFFNPLFAGSFFLCLTFTLYHSALNNFWLADDSQILKHAIMYRPWQYFFSPVAWQRLTANFFTPWLSLSYFIDWTLFGLRPYGFYLHNLLSLTILEIALYLTLRLWLPPALSFFSVIAFAVSPMFAELSLYLMSRHYIEGMIFASLSIFCMVWALRQSDTRARILSGVFYLLACSAKEIYAPLVFFFLVLPEKTLIERVRACIPFFAVAVAYFFWRWFMLGRIVGGYGIPLLWPEDATLFFPRVLNAIGTGLHGEALLWWPYLAGCSALAAMFTLFRTDKDALIRAVIASPLIFLPIVPVSHGMASRYVFLPLLCLILLHAIAWNGISKKSQSPFLELTIVVWAVLVISALAFIASKKYPELKTAIERENKEGVFVLREGTDSDLLIRNPSTLSHSYDGLVWLRNKVLHLPDGPSVLFDERVYCIEASKVLKFTRIWHYDATQKKLISGDAGKYACRTCTRELLESVRGGVPLSVSLQARANVVSWELGPYREGGYSLLIGDPIGIEYSLPASGKAVIEDSDLSVRQHYTSPEGWSAYSPLLSLKIVRGEGKTEWKGMSIQGISNGFCKSPT